MKATATEVLARLDERLARSPVRDGFVERQNFSDAAAALWLEGELVHLEDLVLHDAHMDVRAPTHELTRAHAVLRARRQILLRLPDWALSHDDLRQLTGRGGGVVPPGSSREGEGILVLTCEIEDEPWKLLDEFGDLEPVLSARGC